MALTFAGADADDINHGSGSALDDLSTWTVCYWLKPNASIGVNDKLLQKGTGSGGAGRRLIETTWHDANQIFVGVTCNTGSAEWESETAWISTGVWQYLAFVFDLSVGTKIRGYRGTLTTLASESTPSYTDFGGVGLTSEAAYNLYVGADSSGNSSYYGDIAFVAHYNVVLSLNEIIQQQFRTWRPVRGPSQCVLFCHYGVHGAGGTGTQIDWSGNGNNGTVTGTTKAAHAPINIWQTPTMWMEQLAPAAGQVIGPFPVSRPLVS